MSTDLTPGLPPDQDGGVPRNEDGTFAPAPPLVEQPAVPQPPTTPGPDPNAEALAFYQQHSDAATQREAFMRLAADRGFIPQGADLTPDELAFAAAEYWAWKSGGMGQQQQPQMQHQPPLPGQMQPQAPQFPSVQQPFDPEALATQLEQRVMGAWEQREQQASDARAQQERVEHLHAAVNTVGQGLSPAQQQMLLQNVALGIDTAVEGGQRIDFSRRPDGGSAIQDYAAEVLDAMRGMAADQNTVQTQQAIADHRAIAPRTVTPVGSPQAGAPGAPRGMEGARARARAALQSDGQGG